MQKTRRSEDNKSWVYFSFTLFLKMFKNVSRVEKEIAIIKINAPKYHEQFKLLEEEL